MPHQFVSGDTDSTYKKFISDTGTNALVDLTNKTVQLRWRYTEAGAMTNTAFMTVLNQTTNPGEATYRWTGGQLQSPFIYEDVVVTDIASGRVVTQTEEVRLAVRAKAA